MAKKTPESKEEATARRQRELAALTSGVAAFSLMGDTPRPAAPAPAPVEAPAIPAPAAPEAVEIPAPAPKPAPKPAAAKTAPEPARQAAAAPSKAGVGEGTISAAPSRTNTPAVEEPEELEPEEGETPAAGLPAQAQTGELDLAALFVPSTEKKGTTLRITADHQQFFTNLGFLLGHGASAPDIIHNILNRFRAEHEDQIQKALKKHLRQMMGSKK